MPTVLPARLPGRLPAPVASPPPHARGAFEEHPGPVRSAARAAVCPSSSRPRPRSRARCHHHARGASRPTAAPDGVRLQVRIGIHSGPVTISGGEYVGLTVHGVSRSAVFAAHGRRAGLLIIGQPTRLHDTPGCRASTSCARSCSTLHNGAPPAQVFAGLNGLSLPLPGHDPGRQGRCRCRFREPRGPRCMPGLSPADALPLRNSHGEQLGGGANVEISSPSAGASVRPASSSPRRQHRGGVRRADDQRHDRRHDGRKLPLPG